MSLQEIRKEIKSKSNPKKAKLLQGFFKTGKGEYGEGDIFLGITVPEQRKLAIKYKSLPLYDVEELLKSKIHEERLIALLLLVHNYESASKEKNEKTKKEIFNFYLKSANNNYINNWDLVDLSCHRIVGDYLKDKDKSVLYKLAESDNIWERRISIISAFASIRNHDFKDVINISEILLKDKHDLIHKAVGWMLREMGKRNEDLLISFLSKHYKKMPRTMLRYAIEKLSEQRRKAYLNGDIK